MLDLLETNVTKIIDNSRNKIKLLDLIHLPKKFWKGASVRNLLADYDQLPYWNNDHWKLGKHCVFTVLNGRVHCAGVDDYWSVPDKIKLKWGNLQKDNKAKRWAFYSSLYLCVIEILFLRFDKCLQGHATLFKDFKAILCYRV